MNKATTEVWFRNPHNYIKEIVEVRDARLVAWDRGVLTKKNIDPQAHGNLFFGKNDSWRALAIGDQGCAEVDFEHSMKNPKAVYPAWVYGEDTLEDLEDMIANPAGESVAQCGAQGYADQIPVFGQEHRVVLTNLPYASLNLTKALVRNISELKEDYDHTGVILHLHATYSYSTMFSMGLGATDIDPRTDASKGTIILPPGKRVKAERANTVTHWINILDMTPSDLKVPRNRCIYNIKSALWAGEHFTTNLKFKTSTVVDLDPRDRIIRPQTGGRVILGKKKDEQPGDKVICNSCSLQDSCKYYREDSVCTVPGSEVSPLAEYFKSRNADTIVDALGTVLAAQAQRVERGVELEESFGEIDPHVSKMMNDLFSNGTKLAKLINPKLGGGGVVVNVGGSQAANGVEDGNMKGMMAKAVRAIQSETGLPLEDITNDLIVSMLARMTNQAEIDS